MESLPIPLKIFQTWYTKDLPQAMKERVENLKTIHPRFEHFLFDDKECREFIQLHFGKEVVHAFDHLIPGQYKCDLWKYCVLYIHGGIYIDIKYHCVNGFKLIELMDREHFVLERPGFWEYNTYGIYNGFMVCKPRNNYMLDCVKRIVSNVKTKYYGNSALSPTGPELLGNVYFTNICRNVNKIGDFELFFNPKIDDQIIFKNTVVINKYPEYRDEQLQLQKREHYSILWDKKRIYAA